MAQKIKFPDLPQFGHRDPETRVEFLRMRTVLDTIVRRIFSAYNGTVDSLPFAGEVTLATTPAVTTSISDARILATSRVFLFAKTANAAAAVLGVYATVAAGTITINHTASALADRTFHYAVVP